MDKYHVILSAESQFARQVTLGVLYQQPLSVWHYLIPGMFVIDFLRRGSAISRYTKHFMFPRKLALDAAQRILNDEERSEIQTRIESEIENWLNSLSLYSTDLAGAQKTAVDLLSEHYVKLLRAEGSSYYDLIKNGYASRAAYQAHVRELAAAEDRIDGTILQKSGPNEKLKEKLQLEARQVAMRRNKILENIF